jgi:hypothetical protein
MTLKPIIKIPSDFVYINVWLKKRGYKLIKGA